MATIRHEIGFSAIFFATAVLSGCCFIGVIAPG